MMWLRVQQGNVGEVRVQGATDIPMEMPERLLLPLREGCV